MELAGSLLEPGNDGEFLDPPMKYSLGPIWGAFRRAALCGAVSMQVLSNCDTSRRGRAQQKCCVHLCHRFVAPHECRHNISYLKLKSVPATSRRCVALCCTVYRCVAMAGGHP